MERNKPGIQDFLYGASIFLRKTEGYNNPKEYDTFVNQVFKRELLAKEMAQLFLRFSPPTPNNVPHILELATGTGIIAMEMLRRGYQVTATDINENALEFFLTKYQDEDASLRAVNIDTMDMNKDFPYKENVFDGAEINSAIRYIEDIDHIIKNLSYVLKPNALFIASFSQTDKLQSRVLSHITPQRFAEKLSNQNFCIYRYYQRSSPFPISSSGKK